MIQVNNKFQENKLQINFSGSEIEVKQIVITVDNDIDFKPLVDYLLELIPLKQKLEFNFEQLPQNDDSAKLALIKSTTDEIYSGFNNAISELIEEPSES
jgi:hypothetical protein